MSGYGVPGTPPPKKSGALPLFDLIGAGLGGLSFIWGFLAFYGVDGSDRDYKGYGFGSSASTAIGLSILAGAIAGAVVLSEKAEPVRPPYALSAAVAALLLTFGCLVSKGDGFSAKYGLYLLLVTTLAQVGVLAYSWLVASGKIAAKPAGPPPAQNWGPPQYGQPPQQQPQYGQPPQQQPQYSPPPGYGAPPAYNPNQPTTTYNPSQPQGQPQPPPAGGFGPPTTHGYAPPQSQPQSQPQGPPPGQTPPPPSGPGPAPGGGYGQPPSASGYSEN